MVYWVIIVNEVNICLPPPTNPPLFAPLDNLGSDVSEELFVERFKEEWPDDWKKIVDRFELEEADTPPGKKHPMPEPEVYMKEMCRNCCRRWREEKNGD